MGRRGPESRFSTLEEKREYQRQAQADWRARYPEYMKHWRQANKGKRRTENATFRAVNPTYGKEWRAANPKLDFVRIWSSQCV